MKKQSKRTNVKKLTDKVMYYKYFNTNQKTATKKQCKEFEKASGFAALFDLFTNLFK